MWAVMDGLDTTDARADLPQTVIRSVIRQLGAILDYEVVVIKKD